MMRSKENKHDFTSETSEQVSLLNFNTEMNFPIEGEETEKYTDKQRSCTGKRSEIKNVVLFTVGFLFLILGSTVVVIGTSKNKFPSHIRTAEPSEPTQSTKLVKNSPQAPDGGDKSNQDLLQDVLNSKDEHDVSTTFVESSEVSKVISQGKRNPNSKTISFHVMGDVPYNRLGTKRLEQQVKDISQRVESGEDESSFIIHVGDLMTPKVSHCAEEYFQKPYRIFQDHCVLPVIVTLGDNDSPDCPDPELALSHFKNYFIDPVDTWRDRSHIPSILQRSESREENFALYEKGVLFLGLNMIPELPKAPGFKERLSDNLNWVKSNLEKHMHESRAIVIFGHSIVGQRIFDPIKEIVSETEIPLLYVHGDGHHFVESRLMGTKPMWDRFWRIQVDEGGKAPPLKITIKDPDDHTPFEITNEHQRIYHDMIKIDRMGGLYS